MIVQVVHATITFDRVPGEGELWMLGFDDNVVRQRGGEQTLVPTGTRVQIGPMTRELAEGLAKGILQELSPVIRVNGGPT